jgi:hypothetical protein
METLPSGTPLDPKSNNKMNIDISARKPGDFILYTGPHLFVTCANESRIMNRYFKAGDKAPICENCGPRALWEP